jgi:hypothetical protein
MEDLFGSSLDPVPLRRFLVFALVGFESAALGLSKIFLALSVQVKIDLISSWRLMSRLHLQICLYMPGGSLLNLTR